LFLFLLPFFKYADIEDLAIGSYFYENPDGTTAPVRFCQEKYVNGIIFGFNESYIFDSATETKCLDIMGSALNENFSSVQFFKENNFNISFDTMLEAHLQFGLKTVRFRDLGLLKSPDCFQFNVDVSLNKLTVVLIILMFRCDFKWIFLLRFFLTIETTMGKCLLHWKLHQLDFHAKGM